MRGMIPLRRFVSTFILLHFCVIVVEWQTLSKKPLRFVGLFCGRYPISIGCGLIPPITFTLGFAHWTSLANQWAYLWHRSPIRRRRITKNDDSAGASPVGATNFPVWRSRLKRMRLKISHPWGKQRGFDSLYRDQFNTNDGVFINDSAVCGVYFFLRMIFRWVSLLKLIP